MATSDKIGGAHVNYRMCDNHKLLMNAAAVFAAGAVPRLLDPATYTTVPTTVRGAAPQELATGLWWYRPTQDVKILSLTFLSNTGANNTDGVFEIGLYPRYKPDNTYLFGKRHKVTLTLGTLTDASMSVEPFTNVTVGANKTLRHYDTAVWAYRDCGDLQVFDKGYDTANGTGTIYVDMTGFDSIAIALITLPTSSIQEVVGMTEECS